MPGRSKIKSKSNDISTKNGERSSELMVLFEMQLKDIHWAEKALLKAYPIAETLELGEAEKLFLETLTEEKEADQKLTEVAVQEVNLQAASGHA